MFEVRQKVGLVRLTSSMRHELMEAATYLVKCCESTGRKRGFLYRREQDSENPAGNLSTNVA